MIWLINRIRTRVRAARATHKEHWAMGRDIRQRLGAAWQNRDAKELAVMLLWLLGWVILITCYPALLIGLIWWLFSEHVVLQVFAALCIGAVGLFGDKIDTYYEQWCDGGRLPRQPAPQPD